MPYLLPKLDFQLSAELFWYFPKDWIDQLSQYEANSGIQNITAQTPIHWQSSGNIVTLLVPKKINMLSAIVLPANYR